MQLIIATTNDNKVREYREIFTPFGIEVKGLHELHVTTEVEETGMTFVANATLKAEAIAKELKQMVIADDSGLEIKALEGFPGIYSARFMAGASYEAKCQALIDKMKDKKDRSANFTCAIAIARPNHSTKVVVGQVFGEISTSIRGFYGFGYDPIFLIPKLNKTFGELGEEVKNQMSHRYQATVKLLAWMREEGMIS